MKYLRRALLILALLSGLGMAAIKLNYIKNNLATLLIFITLFLSLLGETILGFLNLRKNPWLDFSGKSRNAHEVITQALDLACLAMSDGSYALRANVFLKCDRDETRLCIMYHSTNMTDTKEIKISFEKWQGCTGQAWGYKAPTVADLTLPEVMGGSKWGLTTKQLKITSHLKAILSLPVRHPDNNSIIAILSFDSTSPIAELLANNEKKGVALQVAKQLGLLLFGFGKIEPL